MFKPSKKQAASFMELLIILMLVGILSVIYNKTVDKNAIITKFAYQNLLDNLTAYTITATDNYVNDLPNDLCRDMFNSFNTIGEANCLKSYPPCPTGTPEAIGENTVNCVKGGLPNFVTTNGMRFYGLEKGFIDHMDLIPDPDGKVRKSIIFDVDLDGLYGNNDYAKDIMSVEIIQNGKIRPVGIIATDPKLYAASATYVYDNEFVDYTDKTGKTQKRNKTKSMGNRLSYAEAHCLTGNIFPYRDKFGTIKLCIENANLRDAITAYQASQTPANETELRRRIGYAQQLNQAKHTCSNSLYGNGGAAYGIKELPPDDDDTYGIYDMCLECHARRIIGTDYEFIKEDGKSTTVNKTADGAIEDAGIEINGKCQMISATGKK